MKPLVALIRSDRVESIHCGYLSVTDHTNNILYSLGDYNTKIFMRSSAKPFIAVTLIKSGAIEKFGLTNKELAVICSSHSGQPEHREVVLGILKKIGLSEEDLECGICDPYSNPAKKELIKNNKRASKLHNCCSGKHCGMLAACKSLNLPTEKYNAIEHPLQKRILNDIASLLGCNSDEIIIGQDGCTVPTYMVSIKQLSYLYAILGDSSTAPLEYRVPPNILRQSMEHHPQMIGGDEEFCTQIMNLTNNKLIAKVGDEGIYCVSVPYKGIGIAVKVADGNERGCYPAIIQVLRQLNILNDEEIQKTRNLIYKKLKDHKGKQVGYILPIFDIYDSNKNMTINNGSILRLEDDEIWSS